jgi:hypothetical protein
VTANSAQHRGGGLYWCDATLRNNTITRNSAEDYGGGMSDCHGAMGNSIVWGNSAPNGPQIYNSATPTYFCIQDWTEGGEGNIVLDPKFVDPDGPDDNPDTWEDNNYHLQGDSPCIDAGKNADWMIAAVDLDGTPRILFGGSSATVDMGAYECNPFKITKISKDSGGTATLIWTSRLGDSHTVWSCSDLAVGSWIELETVPSQGTETTWTDQTATGQIKFYRVEMK